MFVSVSLQDKPVIRALMNLSHWDSVRFLFFRLTWQNFVIQSKTLKEQKRKLSLILVSDCRGRLLLCILLLYISHDPISLLKDTNRHFGKVYLQQNINQLCPVDSVFLWCVTWFPLNCFIARSCPQVASSLPRRIIIILGVWDFLCQWNIIILMLICLDLIAPQGAHDFTMTACSFPIGCSTVVWCLNMSLTATFEGLPPVASFHLLEAALGWTSPATSCPTLPSKSSSSSSLCCLQMLSLRQSITWHECSKASPNPAELYHFHRSHSNTCSQSHLMCVYYQVSAKETTHNVGLTFTMWTDSKCLHRMDQMRYHCFCDLLIVTSASCYRPLQAAAGHFEWPECCSICNGCVNTKQFAVNQVDDMSCQHGVDSFFSLAPVDLEQLLALRIYFSSVVHLHESVKRLGFY